MLMSPRSPGSGQPIVKAEVSTFFIDGEGSTYEQNLFTIAVSIEGVPLHTVERSVVDFVELDRRLRKRLPRNDFNPLPLDEITVLALKKALEKVGIQRNSTASTTTLSPAGSRSGSFSSHSPHAQAHVAGEVHTSVEQISWASNPMVVRQQDRMGATKIKSFNDYLQHLMRQHEVCVSEDLLQFLDEEVPSLPSSREEALSIHDLLLLNEPVTTSTICKGEHETASFTMQPGQMIVWSFTTKDYDIGFSVSVNGEEKLHYTRYNSHRNPACGTLLIESPSLCVLRFDNSYARWHSKQLTYRARVCSFQEYHLAKERALESIRESKQFALRRTTLRRAVVRHAASLSGVIHSTSVLPEAVEQDELRLRGLEVECLRLQNEVSLCHRDLEQAADELESLELANKNLGESWAFTMAELDTSRAKERELALELEHFKAENALLREKLSLAGNNEVIEKAHESIVNNDRESVSGAAADDDIALKTESGI